MTESMTGSAESFYSFGKNKIKIFIKSVNHKYLETSFHSDFSLLRPEKKLEQIIARHITRGRVDVWFEGKITTPVPLADKELIAHYKNLIASVSDRSVSEADAFGILTLPGVLRMTESPDPDFSEKQFLREFEECVSALKKSRLKEGEQISKLLRSFLKSVKKNKILIDKEYRNIRKRNGAALKEEAIRILGLAEDLKGQESGITWTASFLEWADKQSIAEESDRLGIHAGLFEELLLSPEGADKGRRLDFTVQEMQREVNTISSKSRDPVIRHLTVDTKSALENMREQLRNIC